MTESIGEFRALHLREIPLIVPNPWDVGSAVILERLGFKALATTSSGMAFSLGLADGAVSVDQVLEHCQQICDATTVPVSGDLESGYGDSPEEVAAVVSRAASVGLAGCSIEDYTGRPEEPIYPHGLAVERVAAAAEAARSVGDDFVLTARHEGLLWAEPDLDDVILRLQAYQAVGADVLFSPGLESLDDIAALCEATTAPVSVGLEMAAKPTVDQLAAAGVSRISVGAVFVRLAYGAMIESAGELLGAGSLESAADAIDYDALEAFFRDTSTRDTSTGSPQQHL